MEGKVACETRYVGRVNVWANCCELQARATARTHRLHRLHCALVSRARQIKYPEAAAKRWRKENKTMFAQTQKQFDRTMNFLFNFFYYFLSLKLLFRPTIIRFVVRSNGLFWFQYNDGWINIDIV